MAGSQGETPADRTVWHYTTAAGFLNIIRTSTLWATSAAFMNDAQEMRATSRAYNATFENIRGSLSAEERKSARKLGIMRSPDPFQTFLVSACKEPDLLTLWRGYGGEQVAYAIGLDRNVPLSPVEQVDGDTHPNEPPNYRNDEWDEVDGEPVHVYDPDQVFVFGSSWFDVDYISANGGNSHETTLRRTIRDHSTAEAFKRVMMETVWGGAAEKDEGFSDEREVRMALELQPSWKFVKYRESRFGVVPYIELGSAQPSCEYVSRGIPAENRRLPILNVTVGPNPWPGEAAKAARQILDDCGYGAASLTSSSVPFR
ncbi:DUF2971 domain-containing protein [Paramicrobacterium fandaimingii]|uniref:DUF2971 domain-containing protein n=1 Tax=Paramicrobacterium fandaimingii TaxID=2708079 RepID=UPI001422AF23|nr:DUF2971 domain-containing protein [Microbacterium fandaimingii]